MQPLGRIADCRLGKMLDAEKNRGELRPYLRNTNVQWGAIDLSDVKEMRIEDDERDRYAVQPGDLLVCEGGEPGRCAVWRDDREMYLQKALHRVRPLNGTSVEYLRWFLQGATASGALESLYTGSTIKHLPGRQLAQIMVPTPPPAEQRRIAEWLETTDARRASIAGRLAAAREIVDRPHATVLASACSGRLTADWREEHGCDSASEPRASRAAASRRSVADVGPAGIGELPATWEAVALDLLVERIETGKSVRAAGRPADPDEWGVIKVSAMSWGSFLEDENKAIVDPALIDPRYEIHAGDLLISRANTVDLVGATVHVKETRPWLLLSDKSLRLVPHQGIDKAWLNLALSSPASRSQFADRATGTSDSMRSLSQPKILATTLAFPPLPEQHEIVRRVTTALATADRVRAAIDAADAALGAATRSALAKAFGGRLLGP